MDICEGFFVVEEGLIGEVGKGGAFLVDGSTSFDEDTVSDLNEG